MSHVLFEEDGSYKAGTILSDAGASLQIEHPSGKRSKVKSSHVLLRFDRPEPAALLPGAQQAAGEIDVDFLWECAPQQEFSFMTLAADYFGERPDAVQQTALLLKLQSSPVYFHRKGRGLFRPAPAETLRLALAALERKRALEARIESLAATMAAGALPDGLAEIAALLLVKPDRQSAEYRALELACERLRMPPERLLLRLGAFGSAHGLHVDRFACEHFPRGTGFAVDTFDPPGLDNLPRAGVEAFSIDDSTTTEIDDALSVQTLPDGRLRVGVHIAAPALGIPRGCAIDGLARDRMSTVYMPGDKITMLPEAAIRPFSLDAGALRPAMSLYVDLDADGTAIVDRFTRLDLVQVVENLRHDRLEDLVTEAALADPSLPLPFDAALRALWRLTLALTAQRERVRGKPEPRFRTDFAFRIDGDRVDIVQRRRDEPLDRIVAEMMILANSEWGRLLADHGVAGIYRSQQGGRVRMSTHALPHQGIGVPQYIWASSPLRRYVDLANQGQLLALLTDSPPPYAPNDSEFFSLITAFEARYSAYSDFQTRMERYWCLRWLDQRGLTRVDAVVVRDDLVRLADAPFYFRLSDLPQLAPGRRIRVDLLSRDEVDLTVEARFVEVSGQGGELDTILEVDDLDAVERVDEAPMPDDATPPDGDAGDAGANPVSVGDSSAG